MKDLTTKNTEDTEVFSTGGGTEMATAESQPSSSGRPTPETDALILSKAGFGPTDWEWRVHARRLERERDEARVTIEDAKRCLGTIGYDGLLLTCQRVIEERDEAREQRNALAASLEYIASAGLTARHCEDEAKKMLALVFEKEAVK